MRKIYLIRQFTFTFLVFGVILLGVATGCKSYKVASDGYILQGDDNFISIDNRVGFQIGPEFLNQEIWELSSPPLIAKKLSSSQNKIVRSLGYDSKNYLVTFNSASNLPFTFIGLLNQSSLDPESNKIKLYDVSRLNKREKDGAKWYEQIVNLNGTQVYHALIPINEKLFSEKHVSLIFSSPNDFNSVELVQDIVFKNAYKFQVNKEILFPIKTVLACPSGGNETYYDYELPTSLVSIKDYRILQLLNNQKELIYYTLLSPGAKHGAFKVCEGSYYLQYTNLKGDLLWEQEVVITQSSD